ncbi:hypothetical protein GOBAR_AA16749 [Gossypium barbadense]|uniref:Ubiquitin-like domain-containing protein n=1 Tax=Gossypium barbadense TaxID=3634 RepID=A0A2P5XKU1_GOSBA|nr:hypothetical protein GOBAR_AA16749 [Gossypium barbadense]
MKAMYIRVKRSKTTYFIQCDPTETTLDIKQKLHTLIDQPVNDQRLILMNTGDILEDSKTLADQKFGDGFYYCSPEMSVLVVVNSCLTYCLARKNEVASFWHHDNEFEDVNIVKPNDFYQSRDTDSGNW